MPFLEHLTHPADASKYLLDALTGLTASKFARSLTGPVTRDVFTTKAFTNNGSLANQRSLCRAEGGEPLVITTKQDRGKAVQLVKGETHFGLCTMSKRSTYKTMSISYRKIENVFWAT
jgi:hypothetical protein